MEFQEIQGRANSASQVDGGLDMVPTNQLYVGDLSKRNMAYSSTSIWMKGTPSALTLKPDTSEPSLILLVPQH